ncbi:3-dehydroquinate synthase [Prochlorococcus marinus str. MIT 9515]|uniref:3-dehydroquinate synthase n=1 Tax=Prochlorococcus marinus (strain MIT 9515) TaxID=167542 RepID=AROB_PROM5|nr:3-dehydroquinate synthase [Prochlorococcus marinus]A2BW03.1 RecName: Full=3-dehydroquinate synthase; Short=DHQS [Prochlorococcus marinus str. MIT 9515]ABM71964.1 3-dehydroquinate synthase [Prochlorococcus marinus str. MIT 9515]
MNKNKIIVPLSNNSYEVTIRQGIINSIGKELTQIGINNNRKILIVSNKEISNLFGSKLLNDLKKYNFSAEIFNIKAGESYKNLASLREIYDAAFEFGLDRNALLIALGGGIVGDVTGFAAATWLRGIDYIQIPTTLLSMVDSSVGGKTAVNHPKGKNLIGAFYQPKAVFIDPETLKTLPIREFKAGMAEVIKYGVIKDKELFEYLEIDKNREKILNLDNESLIKIINKSIRTKSYIVSKDEKENGIRAILNYGHSFGHVIENLCGYGEYLHGEAISIGMKIAGDISTEKNLWLKEDSLRQDKLIESYGLPTQTPKIKKHDVITILMGDKKVRDGKMRFILPKGIGEVDIFNDIKESQFLKYFD